MKVVLVCGARPNFMKIAPIIRAIDRYNTNLNKKIINTVLVHTGQHYDRELSKAFFEDLKLPEPHFYLGVGSGTHAKQTGQIMIKLEKVLFKENPDLIMVVGDVNSTLAAALTAAKLHIVIAHVEAGLRSFDRTMPEEINRILTDAISDYLFTPSPDADDNLIKERISRDRIYLVGNIMIDSLFYNKEDAKKSKVLNKLGLIKKSPIDIQPSNIKDYALLTLHRPSNVDDKESLLKIIQALKEISVKIPVIFPVHPRTIKNIERFGLSSFFLNWNGNSIKNAIYIVNALGYIDFLALETNAKFVMTDSGGVQEETTVLNIPCLTLRENTERPITLTRGTNTLVGNNPEKIISESLKILEGKGKKGKPPKNWDGKTAKRIVSILTNKFIE